MELADSDEVAEPPLRRGRLYLLGGTGQGILDPAPEWAEAMDEASASRIMSSGTRSRYGIRPMLSFTL
jgi:hypothetical protein